MQLGEETRCQPRRRLIANDVGHHEVADRFIVIERVQTVLVILQGHGELDVGLVSGRRSGNTRRTDAVANDAAGEASGVAVVAPCSRAPPELVTVSTVELELLMAMRLALSRHLSSRSATPAEAKPPSSLVQFQPRLSSKTTSRDTHTCWVAGSSMQYALAPSAYLMKTLGWLQSPTFFS